MPNQLKMSKIQSIIALRQQGWSFTRIARELGIHRQTVADHVREHSKPTQAPAGSEEPKPTNAPTGPVDSKPAEAPRSPLPGGSGRSDCEPLREVIESKLDQGLHARRIFQDLVEEKGFAGSYWSVMRFVRRLGKTRELPFRVTVASGTSCVGWYLGSVGFREFHEHEENCGDGEVTRFGQRAVLAWSSSAV